MFFSVFRQILVTLVDEQAIAFFFLATQQRVFLGKSSALQSSETSFPPNRLTFISDWAVPVVAFERWVSLSKEVKVTLIAMPFSIHIVCMRCCTLFLFGRGSCGYNARCSGGIKSTPSRHICKYGQIAGIDSNWRTDGRDVVSVGIVEGSGVICIAISPVRV